MIKDYITTIYHYRIYLDEKLAKYNNDYKATCFEIIFDNETKYIQNSSFEFSSRIQLTLKEVEDKLKGTVGIDKIEGVFKTEFSKKVEESKYYTPSIEDFHVGFEYQEFIDGHTYNINHISGNEFQVLTEPKTSKFWNKERADWQSLDIIYDDWEHDNNTFKDCYRVKYLDKEDIESLGWKQFEDKENIFDYFEDGLKYQGYQIHIQYNNQDILIFNKTTYMCIFDGTIKNKSELKKLMQQLHIAE
jgi:hypothetical protein